MSTLKKITIVKQYWSDMDNITAAGATFTRPPPDQTSQNEEGLMKPHPLAKGLLVIGGCWGSRSVFFRSVATEKLLRL